MSKEKQGAAVVPIGTPAPVKKRKRTRGANVAGASSALPAAEAASRRIAELLEAIQRRTTILIEAQRAKPQRFDLFAALAEIEELLRAVPK